MYADDLLIFWKSYHYRSHGDQRLILNTFAKMFGQEINASKSAIFFSTNTSYIVKEEIRTWFGVDYMKPDDKYLGMIVLGNTNLQGARSLLIVKTKMRLLGWKQHFLSHAGR